jgi:serine phosphatase RsbU (regulator of sigma subunit)
MDESVKPAPIESAAFQRALLESEERRTIGVVAFALVFAGALAIRIFIFGSPISRWSLVVLVLLAVFELARLWVVRRALRAGRELPAGLWALTMLLEMSLPALGVAFLASPRLEAAYRPLATPWVLAFFPFLVLSTLRLSPWICRLAGMVASAGYLAAAYAQGWRLGLQDPSSYSATQTAVPFYAAILLASGFLAGAVAGEIRKHVQAALREAETRHRLEQVEHDLQIARSIQQSLLPRLRPCIAGFEIAGWNRPADATGGDYFDWKQLADGRLVVSLADVTGHGIGPALLASVCRAYARASFNTQDSLATTLQSINRSLGEDLTPGRFATFVAAICKAGEDRVELLSAGHGPLFVYTSATDTFQVMNAQAVPLGIMPELNPGASAVLDLQPGDLVLLITDGFFEWEDPSGEAFGIERLAGTVRRASHLPPEELIAEIYSAVLAFAQGTAQQDDLTAVVIKRARAGAAALDTPLAA